jgi:hypothetical protein
LKELKIMGRSYADIPNLDRNRGKERNETKRNFATHTGKGPTTYLGLIGSAHARNEHEKLMRDAKLHTNRLGNVKTADKMLILQTKC